MSIYLTMNVVRQKPTQEVAGRRYRGESHETRAKDRKEKLLMAALDVIGTEGFKAATVRKICGKAGLTERYYYEAFGNAHGMLLQVYEQQINRLAATLYSAITMVEKTPTAMAEAALTSLFGAMKKDPRMARVIYIEVVGVSDTLDEAFRRGQRQFDDLLVELSRPLYPEENITDLDDQLIASALVGAVAQVSRDWVLADFDRSITVLVNNMMTLIIGVTNHLQTRTPAY